MLRSIMDGLGVFTSLVVILFFSSVFSSPLAALVGWLGACIRRGDPVDLWKHILLAGSGLPALLLLALAIEKMTGKELFSYYLWYAWPVLALLLPSLLEIHRFRKECNTRAATASPKPPGAGL